MRIEVDGGGYDSAAEAMYSLNQLLAMAYDDFTKGNQAFASMAGSDSCGEQFAEAWDPGAESAIWIYHDIVNGAGTLASMIKMSSTNHRRANRKAVLTPGATVYDDDVQLQPDEPVSVLVSTPPSSLGGDGGGPDWWHWVADRVGGLLYPDADTDQLRKAGSHWTAEADKLQGYTSYLEVTTNLLDRQDSPEVPMAKVAVRDLGEALDALISMLRQLGEGATGFGNDVDDHRDQMEDELKSFIAWTIGIQALSHGLALFTFGGSELIGQSAQVAKIIAAANKVREILVALAAATVLRLGTVTKVIEVGTKAATSIRGLSAASLKMARVRAAGVAGEKAAGIVKNTTRIPAASGKAAFRIPDELDDINKILGEVKNVKTLGKTSQLEDFAIWAQSNGYQMVIYVRQGSGTHLTQGLLDLVKQYGIKINKVL